MKNIHKMHQMAIICDHSATILPNFQAIILFSMTQFIHRHKNKIFTESRNYDKDRKTIQI